jgi:hypothetical protein
MQTRLKTFANTDFRIKFTSPRGNLSELFWNNDISIFENLEAIHQCFAAEKTIYQTV